MGGGTGLEIGRLWLFGVGGGGRFTFTFTQKEVSFKLEKCQGEGGVERKRARLAGWLTG